MAPTYSSILLVIWYLGVKGIDLLPHILRRNASGLITPGVIIKPRGLYYIGYNNRMLFSDLAKDFGRIEQTSLRNEKTMILAEILKEASASEVDKLVYLALGGLRPAFDRLEFNLAEKLIVRAMGVSWGEYKKIGDLGELAIITKAQKFRTSPKVTPACAGRQSSELGITQVYGELEKIARESGSGSQERKVTGLAKLIRETDGESAKYIVRMVAGRLRLGFSDKTVIDALSYLENGTKEFSDELERAYQRRPDVGVLAKMVKEVGVKVAVAKIDVVMGTPIVPALAQRLKTAKEMIEKMGNVYVEPKYDGTRVQIHFSRKPQSSDHSPIIAQGSELKSHWVRTFTRNLDESSAMFPELQRIAGQIKVEEVILDSEAVGYDPKTGKNVPFQLTITRKRKHDIGEAQNSVPLRFNVFDIMYLDGESLINLPLSERRKILTRTVGGGEVLVIDPYIETEDPNVLREYHKKQLAEGLEGVLVKQIDGQYMPGRTGFNWVKFKESEDSRAKLADTLDVVIMGYYLGKGKRNKFGMGAFLIGVRGEHSRSVGALHSGSVGNEDQILTLAKVGTGITDSVFGELKERLSKIQVKMKETATPGVPACADRWEPFTPGVWGGAIYTVPKILTPDVWVEPKIVVEVAADEITVSPTHSAGYALRFPRLVKFREDKGVEQITTLEEIESMI